MLNEEVNQATETFMDKINLPGYLDADLFKGDLSRWIKSIPEVPLHKVTISVDEYLNLLNKKDKLTALESFGVDSWENYEDAMSTLPNRF
jgi:hypothetical protein